MMSRINKLFPLAYISDWTSLRKVAGSNGIVVYLVLLIGLYTAPVAQNLDVVEEDVRGAIFILLNVSFLLLFVSGVLFAFASIETITRSPQSIRRNLFIGNYQDIKKEDNLSDDGVRVQIVGKLQIALALVFPALILFFVALLLSLFS